MRTREHALERIVGAVWFDRRRCWESYHRAAALKGTFLVVDDDDTIYHITVLPEEQLAIGPNYIKVVAHVN